MKHVKVQMRVGDEMTLLSNQVLGRWKAVYSDKGSKRFRYVEAQVGISIFFMEALVARNDEWEWFPLYLDRQREKTLLDYEEAREKKDYNLALSMLGRLRFMTTLARRISDTQRSRLFSEEDLDSSALDEKLLLIRELTLTTEELHANAQRVKPQNNEARYLMALAPVFLVAELGQHLCEEDDCSLFKDSLYDYIETETKRYRAARAAGDRRSAWLMLARVRFSKMLTRRLDNPERIAWISRIAATSPVTQ